MTKNLIQLSQALLLKFSDSNGIPISGRFSTPQDIQAEIAALTSLKSGESWQSPSGTRVFEYWQGDSHCLAFALGLSVDEQAHLNVISQGSIRPIEILGSVFLFLADRLNLAPLEFEPQWIEEYIAGPASEPSGVELDIVKKSLSALVVFEIEEGSFFQPQISGKYVANYICTFDPIFRKNGRLTVDSLDIVREIFLQEKNHLIEGNLFEAIATPSVRHAFLEVYRTLEFVFVLPRARSLLDRLRQEGGTFDIEIMDFARYCSIELGWRRIERDSIGRLFREYSQASLGAYEKLVQNCAPFSTMGVVPSSASEKDRLDYVDRIAARYYQLRNQVAHQFWPDDELSCSEGDWLALVDFTLGCVRYFYEKHLSKST